MKLYWVSAICWEKTWGDVAALLHLQLSDGDVMERRHQLPATIPLQLLARTEKLFCSFCNNFLPACVRPSLLPPHDILHSTNPPLVVDSPVPVSCVYHDAALLPKEAALVRSFAARLQQNLGFLEHGPHTAIGARLRDGGARPRHGPEVGGSAAAGAGHGEEERVAQCGLYIYTLCPASSALWTSCCGARSARTASTASTPASPSPSWT